MAYSALNITPDETFHSFLFRQLLIQYGHPPLSEGRRLFSKTGKWKALQANMGRMQSLLASIPLEDLNEYIDARIAHRIVNYESHPLTLLVFSASMLLENPKSQKHAHRFLQRPQSKIFDTEFQYCPHCSIEQFREHGFVWHRCVWLRDRHFCRKHNCSLTDKVCADCDDRMLPYERLLSLLEGRCLKCKTPVWVKATQNTAPLPAHTFPPLDEALMHETGVYKPTAPLTPCAQAKIARLWASQELEGEGTGANFIYSYLRLPNGRKSYFFKYPYTIEPLSIDELSSEDKIDSICRITRSTGKAEHGLFWETLTSIEDVPVTVHPFPETTVTVRSLKEKDCSQCTISRFLCLLKAKSKGSTDYDYSQLRLRAVSDITRNEFDLDEFLDEFMPAHSLKSKALSAGLD